MPPPTFTPEQESAINQHLTSTDPNSPAKRGRMHVFNIVLAGPRGSGNQAIINRLTCQDEGSYNPTLEDSWRQRVSIQEEHMAMIEYSFVPFLYLDHDWIAPHWEYVSQHAHAIILLYAVTSRQSFNQLQRFYKDHFQDSETGSLLANKPVWLMANKTDLPLKDWEVSTQQGEAFAKTIGARFLSVSARTKEGLEEEDMVGILKGVILADTEAKAGADEEEGKGGREEGGKNIGYGWSFHDVSARLKRLLHKDDK